MNYVLIWTLKKLKWTSKQKAWGTAFLKKIEFILSVYACVCLCFCVTEIGRDKRTGIVKIAHDFDKDQKYAKWREIGKIKSYTLNFYEYGNFGWIIVLSIPMYIIWTNKDKTLTHLIK